MFFSRSFFRSTRGTIAPWTLWENSFGAVWLVCGRVSSGFSLAQSTNFKWLLITVKNDFEIPFSLIAIWRCALTRKVPRVWESRCFAWSWPLARLRLPEISEHEVEASNLLKFMEIHWPRFYWTLNALESRWSFTCDVSEYFFSVFPKIA